MKGDVFLCCFGLKRNKSESVDLPQIVITFHEENTDVNKNPRESILAPGVDFTCPAGAGAPDYQDGACTQQIKPKPLAKNDDLSKAHEEVITQMRRALKEARGGGDEARGGGDEGKGGADDQRGDTAEKINTLKRSEAISEQKATGVPQMAISVIGAAGASGAIGGDKPSLQGSKPPVPQTKALAVAKIRAAIAQAKQGSTSTLHEQESCDNSISKIRH